MVSAPAQPFGVRPDSRQLRRGEAVTCALGALASFGALAVFAGCAGSPAAAGPGEACFRALDCRAGLVCIEGICTADLAPIVPEARAAAPPMSAPPMDAGTD